MEEVVVECDIIMEESTDTKSKETDHQQKPEGGEQQDILHVVEDEEDGEVDSEEDEEEGDEEEGDEEDDEGDDVSSVDDDEIDQLLEEGLPESKRIISKKRVQGGNFVGRSELEYNEKEIIVLEEKSKNSLEVLPGGWIEVRHCSGMPLYLHRKTRVCTLAKPYFLGPGSARRHSIPLSAIPCLAYRRQLDQDNNGLNGLLDVGNIVMKEINEKTLEMNGVAENDGVTELGEIAPGGKRKLQEVVTSTKKLKIETDETMERGHSPTNVVTSGNGEVNLEELIKSPDRQSLNVSREETTTSPQPTFHSTPSQEAKIDTCSGDNGPITESSCKILPVAKVATARENHSMHSVSPEELRDYCKSVFKFKIVTCKRFKTWSARRRHTKEQKRIQLQRPTMPDGVKLISFPIHSNGPADSGKVNKEYIMNPQGKSSVCILHEYVQHALRKQPSYIFRELENAATPYSATVVINAMQYGTGYGSSKKQAKADAAKTALEILIPQMKEQLNGTKPDPNANFDMLPFFQPFGLLDSGISKICKNFSEPPPYGLLLTCLQRNFGQDTCNSVKFEMISPGPQSNKFQMVVGEHSVEVQAPNKREGKQLASQQLLAKLHPNIDNFGSFVKLYGNNSIKSVKEKKQEEQQITTLQSKASANSPNWAILSKLKMEMRKLKAEPPSGLRQFPPKVKVKLDSSKC